jgi:hypothetical protein
MVATLSVRFCKTSLICLVDTAFSARLWTETEAQLPRQYIFQPKTTMAFLEEKFATPKTDVI